jgi:hypothetical protein
VEWPDYHPDSVALIFKALPLVEKGILGYGQRNTFFTTRKTADAEVVPDEVYNSCKLLADYLGIDFYRLSIASDRFKTSPSIEQYKDEEEDENEDEDEDEDEEEEE